MSSYRLGKNLKLNDAALDKMVEKAMSHAVTKYKSAGKKANEELRRMSVIEWFGRFDSDTMLRSLNYKENIHQDKDKIYLNFYSYIDNYEADHTSLYGWNKRHEYPLEPADFIIDLQWNQGIIGLPERSSETSWINYNFYQSTPLKNYTMDIYRNLWSNTVRKYL